MGSLGVTWVGQPMANGIRCPSWKKDLASISLYPFYGCLAKKVRRRARVIRWPGLGWIVGVGKGGHACKNRRHCRADQEGHVTHRPVLMFSGDLIRSAATVFIPGVGDASEDIQAEGFEGEVEQRGGDEDLDTFRQESQENSYDIDQGKNIRPPGWAVLVRGLPMHPRRSRLLPPPQSYPLAGLRDLSEPGETSVDSHKAHCQAHVCT